MNMKQWTRIGVVAASVLLIAACSKKVISPASPAPTEGIVTGASGAQTYNLGQQTGFKVDASGRRINPMYAPANQSYYFSFDQSEMRPEDVNALNIQANYLASHPSATVRLEGNTDNRGSREYNIGLGWRRDQTVARFLQQQGVSPNQIKMVSYGKERPLVLGDSERAWGLNRRVDLIYINPH